MVRSVFNYDLTKYAKSDAEIEEYERRQATAEREEQYRRTVPKRYWKESLDTYRTDTADWQSAMDKARAFTKAVQGGGFVTLILLGGVGTGKTHLACGILREAGGMYRLASTIIEEFRRTRSFGVKETETDLLDSYGRASLLVIDEIGRGMSAQEEQYMLYQIINERYNRRKPMVMISNHTKRDFLNYVGVAAADRLTESANIVEFTWKSYRASKRGEM